MAAANDPKPLRTRCGRVVSSYCVEQCPAPGVTLVTPGCTSDVKYCRGDSLRCVPGASLDYRGRPPWGLVGRLILWDSHTCPLVSPTTEGKAVVVQKHSPLKKGAFWLISTLKCNSRKSNNASHVL